MFVGFFSPVHGHLHNSHGSKGRLHVLIKSAIQIAGRTVYVDG